MEKTLAELEIKHVKSSVAYPQSNGQVEITNKAILQGLKKRLVEAEGNWVDELPNVLWSHRTSPRTPTGETPFRMAYGTDAVLPVEIGVRTLQVDKFSPQSSDEGLRLDNDLLEESRDSTHFKVCQYQDKVAKYYNSTIKLREFKVGDLVLRESASSMPSKMSKLSPPWEGPYRVAKVVRPGTYRLETLNSSLIPNTWNAIHLKKFYP